MAKLTPIDNGLHSLAKGLEAFDALHEDRADVFLLKDAVLRTHHAIETLLKAALFEVNPVFVLKSDTKIDRYLTRYAEFVEGSNAFIIDEEFTIGLSESLLRLRKIGRTKGYSDREFHQLQIATEELEELRNAIQHFAIEADTSVVARVLGNAVPRFVDLLDVLATPASRVSDTNSFEGRYQVADLSGFRKILTRIYPGSDDAVRLLRTRYDTLIRDAITFFSGKRFSGATLSVNVRDHGRVGAPPYMPEVDFKGTIDIDVDFHRMTQLRFASFGIADFRQGLPDTVGTDTQNNMTSYEGSVSIANPSRKAEHSDEWESVVTGSIELRVAVALQNATSVIHLDGAEEYAPVLRDVEIKMVASLKYEALALYDEAHYDVRKLITADGNLRLTITAVPDGYTQENKEHLISGSLQAVLDSTNAPFRLHAFVGPDGTLKGNRHLEWSINVNSDLVFAK